MQQLLLATILLLLCAGTLMAFIGQRRQPDP